MISRYSRPAMAALWADENKYTIWLKIEVLACEAMHQLGQVPAADLRRIKQRARFEVARIDEIEREVNHDVIAFLTNVAEHVGPSSRYIHKGLTSSDVLDTALAVQMVQAADQLIDGVKRVRTAAAKLARKHKLTPMIGRSHGVHAEPITFGLKMALMYDEFGRALARWRRPRGRALGPAVGRGRDPRPSRPFGRAVRLQEARLKPAPISTQVLQRDLPRGLPQPARAGGQLDRPLGHRVPPPAAHRGARGGRALRRGQKGSSAMPHKRNPIIGERLSGLARLLRGYAVPAWRTWPCGTSATSPTPPSSA
jgi:adenylosuccinate lyase